VREEQADDAIHTCNFGVWTEVEWTIVVFGGFGAVGSNIPLDAREVETTDHAI